MLRTGKNTGLIVLASNPMTGFTAVNPTVGATGTFIVMGPINILEPLQSRVGPRYAHVSNDL